MKLPKITRQQQAILHLLYRYRYLNRIQVQALLHHKNRRRINEWLQDLRDKQYVEWIYDTQDFAEKTKPAIYYLGINGIRHLKATDTYPTAEMRKRYYDSSRSAGFIAHSVAIATIGIELADKTSETITYVCQTQADYNLTTSPFHYLTKIELSSSQNPGHFVSDSC